MTITKTQPSEMRAHREPALPLEDGGSADQLPGLMIADDDAVVRSMLGMALSNTFRIVGVAADSSAAIELARVTLPQAATVDVDMPGGGGLSAVRGILNASPHTA